MIKILGFFNIFFGILELHGLYKYMKILSQTLQNKDLAFVTSNAYKIYIYPLLLLVIGIVSLGMGVINIGAFPPKTKRQEILHISVGAFIIFSSTIIFWDLITN